MVVRPAVKDDKMNKWNKVRPPSKTAIRQRIAAAAQRALEEAEARRKAAAPGQSPPKELGGQAGPEPTRYGDWEKKGIISDF
jgi:hypothetical protein